MRAQEFITEQTEKMSKVKVAGALPGAYAITALPNQDPYKQYRFGVAIAAARAEKDTTEDKKTFQQESPWGENMIVVGYDKIEQVIDRALDLVGLSTSDKKLLSEPKSLEQPEISTGSPVRSFKGYPR